MARFAVGSGGDVASVEQCEAAFAHLAGRLAAADDTVRAQADFDRTLGATVSDLGVTFVGRLHAGRLSGIRQADPSGAQIRLTLSSDDLLALVAGELEPARAWASGRLQIRASVLDLLRLRSAF